MTSTSPQHVHLVGSIGLDNVPEIFRTLGKGLGRRLKRVPDGEVGGRRLWVSWQYPLFRANPFLAATDIARPRTGFLELKIADDVDPKDIVFGELGYAREARASYLDFLKAKERRELPPDVRFQVCLPTPLAVVNSFCRTQDGVLIEQAYEKAMIAEVAAVCEAIPHQDLCLQWDICIEMVFWDGQDYHGRTKRADITREAILSARSGFAPPSQPMSNSAFISATAISRPSISWNRATPAKWSSSPTRWRTRSSTRLPTSTCRFPSIGPTTPFLSHCAICSWQKTPRFISAWCMAPTARTAPTAGLLRPANI